MKNNHFPHKNDVCIPVQKFHFGNRWMYLYFNTNRTPSAPYSLYWEDDLNPIQHAMTDHEVFTVLANTFESRFGE